MNKNLEINQVPFSNKITSYIKKKSIMSSLSRYKYLILVLFSNVLVRLPRVSHMVGNDAFLVVWLAKAVSNGWIDAWLITPFSPFGLDSGSLYPIGSVFILSILFQIGFSIDFSVYIFSLFFTLIGIFSSILLGKELFSDDNPKLKYWFALFYTLSPVFWSFTFWTSSLRGPFASILPLTLFFNLRFIRNLNFKNFVFFSTSFFFLSMTHTIFFTYAIIFLCSIIYKIFIKINRNVQINRRIIFYSFIINIIFLLLGIYLNGVSGWSLTGNLITKMAQNFGIEGNADILSLIILIVHYGFSFGIISIYGAMGYFLQTYSLEKKTALFFLILGIPLSIIAVFLDYAIFYILVFFAYFACLGLTILEQRFEKRIVKLFKIWTWTLLIFPNWWQLGIFLIIFIFFIIIPILHFSSDAHNYMKVRYVFFFGSSILVLSVIMIPVLSTSNEFPYGYISDDEIEIANYLIKNNTNNSFTISYDFKIARRISSFAFQLVLPATSNEIELYYGFTTIEQIRNLQTDPSIEELLHNGRIMGFSSVEAQKLYASLLYLDLTINSEHALALQKGLKYVVLPENFNNSGESNHFFESVVKIGNLRVQTSHLRLYEI